MAAPEFLSVPPLEAIAFLRSKGYHVGFHWLDTAAAEHLASFTVSKVAKLDILADIRDALDAGLAEGTTMREFQRRMEPILRAKGWWGPQEMVDPLTGERRIVQTGSMRRLEIIYDTNIRMATARGRWERIARLADRMPYLRYSAVMDARTRPDHALWHGTVLPFDHPFWQTNFPPNGWRCRCTVVQLSERDLDRYGYEVSPDPVVRTRSWTNRRTGQTVQVPVGIDPGFDHNVGTLAAFANTKRVYRGRLASSPADLARAAEALPARLAGDIAAVEASGAVDARRRVRGLLDDDAFGAHARGLTAGDWPVAVLGSAAATDLGTSATVVRLSDWTAVKQLYRHPQLRPGDYALVQRILDEGETYPGRAPNVVDVYLEIDGSWWRAVVKATAEELYLVSFHRVGERFVQRQRRRARAL